MIRRWAFPTNCAKRGMRSSTSAAVHRGEEVLRVLQDPTYVPGGMKRRSAGCMLCIDPYRKCSKILREAYCLKQSCSRPSAAELLVHPEHGQSKLHITDKLAKHGGNDSPLTIWHGSCPNSCLLRKAALRILSGMPKGGCPWGRAFVVCSAHHAHH
jgi:hypothetical protein